MAGEQNFERIINLLACPQCGGHNFGVKTAELDCTNCMVVYPIRNGVPVFIPNPQDTKVMPLDHASNQPSVEIIDWLKELNGYSLNIGAGNTKTKISQCIELEYSIFRNTNIVGDAHRLPFRDQVFDAVVSLNTFEHLYDPSTAAREIFRVLKPGGKVFIHTAFLQPLHEEPAHYYNATKYGISNWFSEFDIEICQVSENFNPAFTLGWLSNDILYFVQQVFGREASKKLAKTTLDDWKKIWLNTSDRSGFLWDTLVSLPQSIQEKFSAGFEIKATKPVNKLSYQKQMLSNSNCNPLPDDVNGDQHIVAQPELGLNKSKDLRQITDKRTLVIARLEIAKLCEVMGKNPWDLISNYAYKTCEQPCISVIVTLFNYSEYIYECLDSVCNSEFDELSGKVEILVVDDCSTDRSASMVEEYLSKSSIPICLIKKSFNTGLADARNTGLKIARSPYVFILDADNWIYPKCLSVLYNAIKSSSYAAVYGLIRKFDNQSKKEICLVSCYDWNIRELVERPYIDAMAMLDKNVILKVGGYSTELIEYGWFGWEDYDLWLKLAQLNYSCKLVPKILSSYRVHSSSMINITNKYTFNIAEYFSKKFPDLVKLYNNSELLFGFRRSEMSSMQQSSSQPSSQSEYTQANLQELQQAYATITAMQSSKFWKLRNRWFKLKKFLGLAEGVDVKI